MVEVRITPALDEVDVVASDLAANGVAFERRSKKGITGLEAATLILSAASTIVPSLTQILLELRNKRPSVTIIIDGKQLSDETAEEIAKALQGDPGESA